MPPVRTKRRYRKELSTARTNVSPAAELLLPTATNMTISDFPLEVRQRIYSFYLSRYPMNVNGEMLKAYVKPYIGTDEEAGLPPLISTSEATRVDVFLPFLQTNVVSLKGLQKRYFDLCQVFVDKHDLRTTLAGNIRIASLTVDWAKWNACLQSGAIAIAKCSNLRHLLLKPDGTTWDTWKWLSGGDKFFSAIARLNVLKTITLLARKDVGKDAEALITNVTKRLADVNRQDIVVEVKKAPIVEIEEIYPTDACLMARSNF